MRDLGCKGALWIVDSYPWPASDLNHTLADSTDIALAAFKTKSSCNLDLPSDGFAIDDVSNDCGLITSSSSAAEFRKGSVDDGELDNQVLWDSDGELVDVDCPSCIVLGSSCAAMAMSVKSCVVIM